jgi:GT2 family glycosyltransferase
MDSAKTCSIHIVTWNSARYLPGLFDSLDRQTSHDFTVTIVDNASSDGTPDRVVEHPDIVLLKNYRNQGFSRAHNQAIALALSRWESQDLDRRYVLVGSPDMEFDPDCIKELIHFMDDHSDVAVCGPKLLRAIVTAEGMDGRMEVERTNILDAMGIAITKARRATDRGAGEDDKGQYDNDTRVFGLSGACFMIRASALQKAKVADEWFDGDFFAYKEDVDLAWRLRLMGMEARVVPFAKAWHHRRSPSHGGGWLTAWFGRRAKSPYINLYSSRNHAWLLIKNDSPVNLLMHLPWWLPYELAKFIAGFISPTQLKGEWASLMGMPAMFKKRKELKSRVTVSPEEIRKWFV